MVIKLTHNDINEMVCRAVMSILNESVDEVQGSIMADKEDVIEEIVNFIEERWELMKEHNSKPVTEGTFTYDDRKGIKFSGKLKKYVIMVPFEMTEKLGTSASFEIYAEINSYTFPEGTTKYLRKAERATDGSSYGAEEYTQFNRATCKVEKSRVDLSIPSINGELQTAGLSSTLYHELNHNASRLEIQKKHQYLDDDELSTRNFSTMARRGENPPHYLTFRTMQKAKQDSVPDFLKKLLGVEEESQEIREAKGEISYVFYSLWETTERNAKAEAIYGDLKAMKAKRENFKTDYQNTELHRQINELKMVLEKFEEIPVTDFWAPLWGYAGEVMGIKPRGKNTDDSIMAERRLMGVIKERFIRRSKQLLKDLYKRGMKVAELYFQRREDKENAGKETIHTKINARQK